MLGTVESASAAALSSVSRWILVGQFPSAIISMSLPFTAIAPAALTPLLAGWQRQNSGTDKDLLG
jgi:hypothetical protein